MFNYYHGRWEERDRILVRVILVVKRILLSFGNNFTRIIYIVYVWTCLSLDRNVFPPFFLVEVKDLNRTKNLINGFVSRYFTINVSS